MNDDNSHVPNEEQLSNGNTNSVQFRSEDIGKKQATNYFVRVEGAKERKKEALKRLQQQKEELEKDRKTKAQNAKRAKRRAKTKNFFHSKIGQTVAVLNAVIIIAGIGTGLYFALKPKPVKTEEEVVQETVAARDDFTSQIAKQEESGATREEIIEWINKELKEDDENGQSSFAKYQSTAEYILADKKHLQDAKPYIDKMLELAKTKNEIETANSAYASYLSQTQQIPQTPIQTSNNEENTQTQDPKNEESPQGGEYTE